MAASIPTFLSSVAHPVSWRHTERSLLVFFLVLQVVILVRHLGIPFGYDVEGHLRVLTAMRFPDFFLDVRHYYYAYHPPLGFLLAALFRSVGFGDVGAAQIVSWSACLATFFLLRATVRLVGRLETPQGIVFLYFAASMPIAVYLSISVNLDALVAAEAAAILFVSCRMFVKTAVADAVWLWLLLCAALLTKYSGLLLFTIPFLVLVVSGSMRMQWRKTALIVAVSAAALLCVSPYYYLRNYAPHGTWFYSNATEDYAQTLAFWKEKRDESLPHFFLSLFLPHTPADRDTQEKEQPRFLLTWRGFWGAMDRPPQSPLAGRIGLLYSLVFFFLAVLGCVHFLTEAQDDRWKRLGWVLLLFGAVQIGALVAYHYQFPVPGYLSAKAIYIAPLAFTIAYFVAQNVVLLQRRFQAVALWLLVVFMSVNVLMPVY